MLGLAVQLLSNVVEDVERVALGTAEAALRESSSATTSMRFLENEEDEEKALYLKSRNQKLSKPRITRRFFSVFQFY